MLVFKTPAARHALTQKTIVFRHVVRMNPGKRRKITRQHHTSRIRAQHAQKRRTRIHHAGILLNLQQRHAFFHVLQQRLKLNRRIRQHFRFALALLSLIPAADVIPVAPLRLGLVQRRIRTLVQLLKRPRLPGRYVHANARTHMQRRIHANRKLQRLTDAPRLLPRLLLRNRTRNQRKKLVPAKTPHNVRRPKTPRKSLRRQTDDLIPGLMTQRVVHLLEIVQINNEQRTHVPRMHVT